MDWPGYAREALIERAGEAKSVTELFITAAERLRGLLPYDSSVWLATDPATGLPTSPTWVDNLDQLGGQDTCSRVWELEFLVEDVNLYRHLARSDVPAAGLRLSTGDRPARSSRYRDLLRPHGFGDELRAVLRGDGRAWALCTLLRERGRPAFTADESALVASLSEPLGEALRDLTRPCVNRDAHTTEAGPGLMLFDAYGRLTSVNDDAQAWLDELTGDHWEGDEHGVRLPMVVLTTLMRARAIAEEREHGHARARTRSASGRWLLCHASCLRTLAGDVGETVLVIEPAPASEVAPIIAEAYELSARERQITELIAQGCATAEIAERLFLSPHTVRDYVKTIFDKVGVSSRGELVAHLFAEHYAPIHFHKNPSIAG